MNKVEFGICKLHVGLYTVDDEGNVTLGEPYHQKGAIGFTPELDNNKSNLDADNIEYWAEYTDGAFEGDVEVAKFDDDFKVKFLGYKRSTKGGIGKVKGATKPRVYVAFEITGDKEERREIFYNCALGAIKRGYNTIKSEGKEVDTEAITVTCSGDNASGFYTNSFYKDDAGYDEVFTSPTAPVADDESE